MDPSRDPRPDERAALSRRAARQPRYFVRTRRWLRPPRRLRPTRAGWIYFALTFGVGFAALNTGNNLLYLVLALMLAFLVLSGVLSESALRGIRVRRRVPRELFADREATVALEIANTQLRVAAFAVVVEDRIAGSAGGDRAAGRCFCLRVGPCANETRTYRLRPTRRGGLDFHGFVVYTRFPFGLFSKSLVIEAPEHALVYPAVEPVVVPPDFGGARNSGSRVSGRAGAGADVGGVREYAPGDALRRIHWRSSLRAGLLLVREVESEHDAEVEVRLRTADTSAGEAFERLVSWAASEVVALLEAGRRVALRTDTECLAAGDGAAHRARVLSFLARVEPAERAAQP
jgi:uncharacterized protein (DUF58 family)